jgi:glycosyltransferase involved in cell wall biosynthesis
LKVLHVDSARGWRGGQNQVLLTAAGMARRGHDVVVACQRGGVLEERARAAGLDVRPVSFHGDLSPVAAMTLRRVIRASPPHAVQAHDPHALGAVLLAVGGAPLFATRRVDFDLQGWPSRWKYGRARRVIAVSGAVASVLARGGVPASRVRVVYEGVPDRQPQPGGREALAALGIPRDALVVGNVAALTDHKDHATLLKAAARVVEVFPGARFVVVGEGELRDRLQAQAAELGLGDRAVFTGFRDDLDRLIPAFDVFCLSSHQEGLGTSVLDAMCFGRPVVGTAAGGIPEAVDDGVTGRVVPPRHPDALAAALVAVLQDARARRVMGEAGRKRFAETFTVDRMVESTLGVYQEIA